MTNELLVVLVCVLGFVLLCTCLIVCCVIVILRRLRCSTQTKTESYAGVGAVRYIRDPYIDRLGGGIDNEYYDQGAEHVLPMPKQGIIQPPNVLEPPKKKAWFYCISIMWGHKNCGEYIRNVVYFTTRARCVKYQCANKTMKQCGFHKKPCQSSKTLAFEFCPCAKLYNNMSPSPSCFLAHMSLSRNRN